MNNAFIKLTVITFKGGETTDNIFVNPREITSLLPRSYWAHRGSVDAETRVVMNNGDTYDVKESIKEILEINQ